MYQYNLFLRDNLLIYISTDNFGMEKNSKITIKILFLFEVTQRGPVTHCIFRS